MKHSISEEKLNGMGSDGKRRIAVRIGLEQNSDSIDLLQKLVQDEDESVRLAAVWAIGEVGSSNNFQSLLEIYEENPENVQFEILKSVYRLKNDSYGYSRENYDLLIDEFENSEYHLSLWALQCLSLVKSSKQSEEISDYLINNFQRQDELRKSYILKILPRINLSREKASELLIKEIDHENSELLKDTALAVLMNNRLLRNSLNEEELSILFRKSLDSSCVSFRLKALKAIEKPMIDGLSDLVLDRLDNDESVKVRIEAAKLMAETSESYIGKLFDVIEKETEAEVRIEILDSLGSLLDSRIARKYSGRIKNFLDEENPDLVAKAIQLIADYRLEGYRDILIQMVDDSREAVRKITLEMLIWDMTENYFKEKPVEAQIREPVDAFDGFIPLNTGYLDNENLINKLKHILSGDRPEIMALAIELAAEIRDDEIKQIVREKYENTQNNQVKAASIKALGIFQDEDYLSNIIREANKTETPHEIKEAAVGALGNFQSDEVLEVLNNIAQGPDSDLRFISVKSMGRTGNQKAIEFLKEIEDKTEDRDILDQIEAAKARIDIENDITVRFLTKAILWVDWYLTIILDKILSITGYRNESSKYS